MYIKLVLVCYSKFLTNFGLRFLSLSKGIEPAIYTWYYNSYNYFIAHQCETHFLNLVPLFRFSRVLALTARMSPTLSSLLRTVKHVTGGWRWRKQRSCAVKG